MNSSFTFQYNYISITNWKVIEMFFTKKKTVLEQMQASKVNCFGTDLSKLDENGNLPFGWIAHNQEFIKQIESEYIHFKDEYRKSKNSNPLKQYSALKSFLLYLQDAEKFCKSKGECHAKWFYDIIYDEEYISEKEEELKELTQELKG